MSKRDIKYLVIHTSASWQTWTAEALHSYFINYLDWSRPGYHVVIEKSGRVKRLLSNDTRSNGVKTFRSGPINISNSNSVNICWIGGIEKGNMKNTILPKDNRTDEQKEKLRAVVSWYVQNYPDIKILGHNQIANKACPCFAVPEWCKLEGIPEKNIYLGSHYGRLINY